MGGGSRRASVATPPQVTTASLGIVMTGLVSGAADPRRLESSSVSHLLESGSPAQLPALHSGPQTIEPVTVVLHEAPGGRGEGGGGRVEGSHLVAMFRPDSS